jgi:transcriptional regulator with PAS, ATPase and Fis domain
LVTWLGIPDLLAGAKLLGDREVLEAVRRAARRLINTYSGSGHIMPLLRDPRFDEIHALSIWGEPATRGFGQIYEGRVTIHPLPLVDQFSFDEVLNATNRFLEALVTEETDLMLYLTPGTHAMVASFLLLGKTRFPATFLRYDESVRGVVEEKIPVDLVMSSIGDRLRLSDAGVQGFPPFTRQPHDAFGTLVGKSREMTDAIAMADRIAKRDVDVLILGESGTGKELFASAIHSASPRGKAGKPFVAINCAAIPETLFESELFGSLPGAFTGAKQKRQGAFERADGGTLFLDEVGELSPANQAKLLRALQPLTKEGPCIRMIQPVGVGKQSEQVKVDVRVIAATNRDLQDGVRVGAFREDLLYRLGAVSLRLPPLRGRPSDIELIARALLDRINDHFQQSEPGYRRKRLTQDAIVALCRRQWPGNIRELEAVLKQLSVFLDDDQITAAAVERFAPEAPSPFVSSDLLDRPPGVAIDLKQRTREIEAHFVREAIREAGTQKAAAGLLGISQQMISKVLTEAGGAVGEDEGKPGKS